MVNAVRLRLTLGCALVAAAVATSAAPARDGATIWADTCASCHDAPAPRVPDRAALAALPTAHVVRALETGVMRVVGNFELNGPERVAVAEFVTGERYDPQWNAASGERCAPHDWPGAAPFDAPHWNGWGNGPANRRFQDTAAAGLTRADVPRLELDWAFAFPGETIAESQPSVVAGRVFVGSRSGTVYALDAANGCEHWRFEAQSPVKTSIVIGQAEVDGAPRWLAFFGTLGGTAFALDATAGTRVWSRRVDDFHASRLMGSFQLADGTLFVPVTATESTLAAAADVPCCTFRGSVVALDPATGTERWRRYTIAEEPRRTGENAQGVPTFGPSGATIWSAPTFDRARGRLYVGTGENASRPATATSDAILAIDPDTTAIDWVYQGLADDAWNMSCGTADRANCPADAGPDFDFGSSPILDTTPDGRPVLIAAQKSGVVHALDPAARGALLWQRKLAAGGVLGGIEWGPASDGQRVYVALADIAWNTADLLDPRLALDPEAGGGLVALELADGRVAWRASAVDCGTRPQCSPAQTAAVTAIPGAVFAGSMSGHLRAFDSDTGDVLWTHDTVRDYPTVNGARGRGGALDATGPVVVGGRVFVVSGYSKWGGLPGNVLLVFRAPEE